MPVPSLFFPPYLLLRYTSTQPPFCLYLNFPIPIFIHLFLSVSYPYKNTCNPHILGFTVSLRSPLQAHPNWNGNTHFPCLCNVLTYFWDENENISLAAEKKGQPHIFGLWIRTCVTFPAANTGRSVSKAILWCLSVLCAITLAPYGHGQQACTCTHMHTGVRVHP